jgi:hypothetical protein
LGKGVDEVVGGEAARNGRGSFEAERRDFDFDFRFEELVLSSSSLSEELVHGSSSSWMPGTLGGLDIRRPGMHVFVV